MTDLTAHGWSLTLDPARGGAVTRLSHAGRDVLRPAGPGSGPPLDTGCFALLPFANRIDRGRFRHQGREVNLPALDAFAPHALHGEGWLRPWQVDREDRDEISLVCRHTAADWPWDWVARQTVSLRPGAAAVNANVDELTSESSAITVKAASSASARSVGRQQPEVAPLPRQVAWRATASGSAARTATAAARALLGAA